MSSDIVAKYPPLLTTEQIALRVKEMAAEIAEVFGTGPITILTLLKGSFIFTSDLVRQLAYFDNRLRIEFITASSYGDSTESEGEVRLRWHGALPQQHDRVLIIDDILDTGCTISNVKELTLNQKPSLCKVAVLLDKPSRRKINVTADFTGFRIDDHFVVGYGLDFAEHFRELPYLTILPPFPELESMSAGRLLLLINDRSLQVEIERGLSKHTTVVTPSHLHSIEDCITEGKYFSAVLSFDFANRYQSELLAMSDRAAVAIERLLIYKQDEWEKIGPLVERGVVTRLVPNFWDVQSIVDMLVRLSEREEIEHALNRHHTHGLAEGSEADLRKRVFELEMQNRRLNALATTDALTGLANRRELNDVLTREIMRSKRFGYPLSFVMCDVDFFKNYNDVCGHPAGDDVLQTIASLMRSRLRGSDIAARYGGEEFGLILPQTTKDQALRVAESLRLRIEENKFPNEEKQPSGNLTVSMGVAGMGVDGDTTSELIDRADRALYRAKQTGRNRVVAFDKNEPDWPTKEPTPIET